MESRGLAGDDAMPPYLRVDTFHLYRYSYSTAPLKISYVAYGFPALLRLTAAARPSSVRHDMTFRWQLKVLPRNTSIYLMIYFVYMGLDKR